MLVVVTDLLKPLQKSLSVSCHSSVISRPSMLMMACARSVEMSVSVTMNSPKVRLQYQIFIAV